MVPQEKKDLKTGKEKIQWFLDEVDSYKEEMGKWYTVLFRRILPFLIFVIPLNIISNRFFCYIRDRYLSGIFQDGEKSFGIVIWLFSMVVFLVILIFLPRFGTFCEFVLAPVYLMLAFKLNLMGTGLGYFVIISLSLFMFLKLVFLVFEIMYHVVFHGEKAPKAYHDGEEDVVF